jgi:uncharacterized protein YyaL (SSP411 family)
VAIVGRPGDDDTEALLRVVRRAYLPNTAVALRRPDDGGEVAELVPLLQGRTALDGKATAYVCERFACQRPVTTPEDLAWQLGVDA